MGKIPRVQLNRKKYMMKDLSEFITGRMKTQKLTQAQMGQEINLSQPAFNNRLKKGFFSYPELLTILKVLNATDEEILRLMKL